MLIFVSSGAGVPLIEAGSEAALDFSSREEANSGMLLDMPLLVV
jgi:hypothetical protein